MAFIKADPQKAIGNKNKEGIVYILIMVVDGHEVYKIGVTSRDTVKDRVLEIVGSHLNVYRFVPYTYPKRFRKTKDIYEKEKILHEHFKKCRYESEKNFGGCKELFMVDDMEYLLEVYEKVLDGKDIGEMYENKTDI